MVEHAEIVPSLRCHSFVFCTGAGNRWSDMAGPERGTMGGLLLVLLGGGQAWMVFRGLLIGRLPLAWSQADVVAFSDANSTALTAPSPV